jgi:hypothetical protein
MILSPVVAAAAAGFLTPGWVVSSAMEGWLLHWIIDLPFTLPRSRGGAARLDGAASGL